MTTSLPELFRIQGDWDDDAACRGMDHTWWWLAEGQRKPTDLNRRAQRVCDACPIREECLNRAVQEQTIGVIRGGVPFFAPREWATCGCGNQFLRPTGRPDTARTCDPCRQASLLRAGQQWAAAVNSGREQVAA